MEMGYLAPPPKMLSSEIKTIEFSSAMHDGLPIYWRIIEKK